MCSILLLLQLRFELFVAVNTSYPGFFNFRTHIRRIWAFLIVSGYSAIMIIQYVLCIPTFWPHKQPTLVINNLKIQNIYIFHRLSIKQLLFLSCRPFVVITTLSTDFVGVKVDRSNFNTHKSCYLVQTQLSSGLPSKNLKIKIYIKQ